MQKYTYANGATYDGQWEGTNYSGKGKYTYPDESYYEGDFINN